MSSMSRLLEHGVKMSLKLMQTNAKVVHGTKWRGLAGTDLLSLWKGFHQPKIVLAAAKCKLAAHHLHTRLYVCDGTAVCAES